MSCKSCNESNQQSDSFNNDLAMSHMCKIIRLLIVCLLCPPFCLRLLTPHGFTHGTNTTTPALAKA